MGCGHALPDNIVPHPRFGLAFSPETVIPADLTRQNFTAVPILRYADRLLKCRNCRRPFVFFAREQKYWYEDLRFNISARCVRCPVCRRSEHRLRRRFQRYSLLVRRDDLSDPELATLVGDAVWLYEAGILEDEQRLRRLKNLALARIPEEQATKEIVSVISGIREIGGQRLAHVEALMLRGIIRLLDSGAEVVTEEQANATAIPPDHLDLGDLPSYANAFARLMRWGLLTWAQDLYGAWGVRPTREAIEGLRKEPRNV
jgi:hypothetical protein